MNESKPSLPPASAPPQPLRFLKITEAHATVAESGHPILRLTVNGRPAYVREPDRNLLADGIAVLLDDDGFWKQTALEYYLTNVGDDPLPVLGGCRDAHLLTLARHFVAGDSGDLLKPHASGEAGGSRSDADLTTAPKKGNHARGLIHLTTDYGNVRIGYREHHSRDARLLVEVDGNPLDADQLIHLTEQLQRAGQTLVEGRRRYVGMMLTMISLQNLDPAPDDS